MLPDEDLVELRCRSCDWVWIGGCAGIDRRLRRAGLLRRATPDAELLLELLRGAAETLPCDRCGAIGLAASDYADDDDWQSAVLCEVCRRPIDPERLAAIPAARRCAPCQQQVERGHEPEEIEYCPKCGAILELRVSTSGGTTRYKQFCTGSPSCRLSS